MSWPTSWNDQNMDWNDPDPNNVVYYQAIKTAMDERMLQYYNYSYNLMDNKMNLYQNKTCLYFDFSPLIEYLLMSRYYLINPSSPNFLAAPFGPTTVKQNYFADGSTLNMSINLVKNSSDLAQDVENINIHPNKYQYINVDQAKTWLISCKNILQSMRYIYPTSDIGYSPHTSTSTMPLESYLGYETYDGDPPEETIKSMVIAEFLSSSNLTYNYRTGRNYIQFEIETEGTTSGYFKIYEIIYNLIIKNYQMNGLKIPCDVYAVPYNHCRFGENAEYTDPKFVFNDFGLGFVENSPKLIQSNLLPGEDTIPFFGSPSPKFPDSYSWPPHSSSMIRNYYSIGLMPVLDLGPYFQFTPEDTESSASST